MTWWQWVLFVLGALVVFGVVALLAAFAMSPEEREHRAVQRRMQAKARAAREQIRQELYDKNRAELRQEKGNP